MEQKYFLRKGNSLICASHKCRNFYLNFYLILYCYLECFGVRIDLQLIIKGQKMGSIGYSNVWRTI